MSLPSRFWSLFNVGAPFDVTNRFETSTLLSPTALGSVRLLLATYGATSIVVKFAIPGEEGVGVSFSYFSNITWWGITFYHLFAGFHTLAYARTGRAPLQSWPRFLQLAHSLLYSTVVTYPLMVTIVFWAMQYKPSKFAEPIDAWSNVSRHALNSVFAIFEIVVPRTERPPLIHVIPIVVMLGGYAGIAYITHVTEGFYTYGFLDPSKHKKGVFAGIIIGMGAICIVVFFIVSALIWLRVWYTEEKLGRIPKTARRNRPPSEGSIEASMSLQSKEMTERYEMSTRVAEV